MMLNEKYFLDFNLFCFELISDTMEKAVALLLAVERECARLELHLNTLYKEDKSDGFQHRRYLCDHKRRSGTRGCRRL